MQVVDASLLSVVSGRRSGDDVVSLHLSPLARTRPPEVGAIFSCRRSPFSVFRWAVRRRSSRTAHGASNRSVGGQTTACQTLGERTC